MKRMNTHNINIGGFFLAPYARTEQHIKDVADCNIDFIMNMDNDRPALDLFSKYNLGAILVGVMPGWWGGHPMSGHMDQVSPIENYEKAAKNFVDHPAVWGLDVGDEPNALDFPHFGNLMDRVNKMFPELFACLNLYPNYASVVQNTEDEVHSQLGTRTYAEHIEKYCQHVPAEYISYDFYMYHCEDNKHDQWLENLRIVADACLRTGRKLWVVPQVNCRLEDTYLSENMLRFQAFSSMAFGAETIVWACYTAGWFYNQVLDKDGNKTEQYDKLKKVNAEIHTIGQTYMRYRRVNTHFVGFAGYPEMDRCEHTPIDALNTGVFLDLKADDGSALLVGELVSRTDDGTKALMICPMDDPYDTAPKNYTITFKARDRQISAIGGNGAIPVTKLEDGTYSVPISSNQGVLILAK